MLKCCGSRSYATLFHRCLRRERIAKASLFPAIAIVGLAAQSAFAQTTRHQAFNINTTGLSDVGVRYFGASYGLGYSGPEPPWTALLSDGQAMLMVDPVWYASVVPKPGGGLWDNDPEIRFPFVGSGLDILHLRDDAGEVFDWEIVDSGANNTYNVVASGTVDTFTAVAPFAETIVAAPQGSLSTDRIHMLRLKIRDTDGSLVRRRIFIDAFDVYDEVPLNFDDDSNFSGNWNYGPLESWNSEFDNLAYEGTRTTGAVAGSTLDFNFVGTSLVAYGWGLAGFTGSYDWEIDGGLRSGTVDQSVDSGYAVRWPELLINGLSSGPHTLKITVNGADSGFYQPNDGFLLFDAIAVYDSGIVIPGVEGDYNGDFVVNAADYVVWRDRLGSSFTLPGENPNASTPGLVDQEDYDFWKSRFGATSGAASISGVPEPSTLMLLVTSLIFAMQLPTLKRSRRLHD